MIDTDTFIKKGYRILKPGGYLILSTPNLNCLRNRLMVPLGKYPVLMEHKNIIHHVRLYNRTILEKHLNEYNFQIVKTIGVQFLKEKHNKYKILKYLSEKIADRLPQFCNNIITIARKNL
jgi:2-polyprenyl-3-methyl-5-hydroxy-6-metoxy-1,4-benzoquinol methylase